MNIPKDKRFLALQVAFAFIVTICLAIWQFGKGLDTLVEREEHRTRLAQEPLDIYRWQEEPSTYRHIDLRGSFDLQRMFLIEGKAHAGQSGYWVVGVFNTDQGRFLVNRGWVQVQGNVSMHPSFPTPNSPVNIRGVLWPKSEVSPATSRINPNATWPIRVRDLNINAMAARTGAHAHEIRLVAGSAGVLVPVPLETQFKTAMHWGYSAQWLLIGTLILAGFWYFVLRPNHSQQDQNK
ncbi:MAG: SURF1 family protein [Gammaproteobacteria bacterium]|nr:SURF1 family protein [Gammaproteobacteria bacterium]